MVKNNNRFFNTFGTKMTNLALIMSENPSMLKKIKSLFVVEAENPAVQNSENKRKVNDVKTEVPTAPSTGPAVKPSKVADQQLTAKLREAIEANNLEGFDYLEFKNTLNSIIHVIEDEATRYKTAFEMAKTMGASKDTLLDSINHYVDILKNEAFKFDQALENQKQKQITSREEDIHQLQKSVKDKEELIQKLTSEISDTRKKMDEKRSELQQAVDKIENTHAQFTNSIESLNQQLLVDQQNLTKYI